MWTYNVRATQSTIRVLKSGRIRWAGHIVHMRVIRNAYKFLPRKPEGERPLARPRHRW